MQCNLGISSSLESKSYFGIVTLNLFFCLILWKRGIFDELFSKDLALIKNSIGSFSL